MIFPQLFTSINILNSSFISSRIIVLIPDSLLIPSGIYMSLYFSFLIIIQRMAPFWDVTIILIMMRCHLVDKRLCFMCN